MDPADSGSAKYFRALNSEASLAAREEKKQNKTKKLRTSGLSVFESLARAVDANTPTTKESVIAAAMTNPEFMGTQGQLEMEFDQSKDVFKRMYGLVLTDENVEESDSKNENKNKDGDGSPVDAGEDHGDPEEGNRDYKTVCDWVRMQHLVFGKQIHPSNYQFFVTKKRIHVTKNVLIYHPGSKFDPPEYWPFAANSEGETHFFAIPNWEGLGRGERQSLHPSRVCKCLRVPRADEGPCLQALCKIVHQ